MKKKYIIGIVLELIGLSVIKILPLFGIVIMELSLGLKWLIVLGFALPFWFILWIISKDDDIHRDLRKIAKSIFWGSLIYGVAFFIFTLAVHANGGTV